MNRVTYIAAVLLLVLGIGWPVAAQSLVWTCHGPYGGRILAMAISPDYATDATVFAGAERGGLFRSIDGGESWQPVGGLPLDLTISGIVVSPDYATDQTLFVSSTQGGIFKSWDGGESWRWWSDGLASLAVAQLAISPNYGSDQTLLAATDRSLYLSTTAGKVWTAVGPSLGALTVAVAPIDSGHFVAFGGTAIGLYVSTNGGDTWEETALSGAPAVSISFSPNYAADHHLLVGTLAGAYFSPDGGSTWQGPWLADSVIHQVLFSANYATDGKFYLGVEGGGYTSTDGGQSWLSESGIPETVRSMVTSLGEPAHVFAGLDSRGVYASHDGGDSWQLASLGITSVVIETVAASPAYSSDATLLAGGPGGVWRSVDDGQSWQRTTLDYAAVSDLECAADYASSRKVFAATKGGVFASVSGGRRWFSAQGDLEVLGVQDVTLSPAGGIWIGTTDGGAFYSNDDGRHWQPRSQGLGSQNVSTIQYVGQLDGHDYLVVGTRDAGVYYSSDGGITWTPALRGPQSPHPRALATGVGFADRVWTFAATSTGVFRSGDLGDTWDDAGLFGLDLCCIALHPDYAARPNCYAGGTRDGVFQSLNGGLTWGSLNHGLGNRHVSDVEVAMSSEGVTLVAATSGGVWRYGGTLIEPEGIVEVDLMLPLTCNNHSTTVASGYHSMRQSVSPEASPVRKDR